MVRRCARATALSTSLTRCRTWRQPVVVYPRWLLETQGARGVRFPSGASCRFAPCIDERRDAQAALLRLRRGGLGCYLFYLVFEEWWYLRFLLPAFPFVFILGADAVSTLARRIGPDARHAALLVFRCAAHFWRRGGVIAARDVLVRATASDDMRTLRTTSRRPFPPARWSDDAAQRKPGVLLRQAGRCGTTSWRRTGSIVRSNTFRCAAGTSTCCWTTGRSRCLRSAFAGSAIRGGWSQTQPLAITIDGRVRLFAATAGEGRGAPVPMPRTHGCLPPADSGFYGK